MACAGCGPADEAPPTCCLIMELMRGGNLLQRIYDRSRKRLTLLEILLVGLAS